MALRKCHECAAQISSDAKSCPQCGAKQKRPTSTWVWGGLAAAVLLVAISGKPPSDDGQAISTAQPVTAPAAKTLPADFSVWKYEKSVDQATGKPSETAFVSSFTNHEFKFPYAGKTYAGLTLRKHPRFGKDIIFNIDRGQLLCSINDDCTVLIRFDDAQPVRVKAVYPEDQSRTTLFLEGYGSLLGRLQKARQLVVTATVFQEGERSWEFRVNGLKWD